MKREENLEAWTQSSNIKGDRKKKEGMEVYLRTKDMWEIYIF